MAQQFRTHTGEIISGERLQRAINKVADDWAELSRAIRREDCYAEHVTTAKKDEYLAEGLARAESIRAGDIQSFTIWQRVNAELTGECVALFSR